MKRTFRVFISSTYLDNEERRNLVTDVVIRAGMVPVGMERFAASQRGTVEECERLAREADLLLGIVAHRYGWIPEGQSKSITELEYEAQPERLMFLIDDNAPIRPATAYDALPSTPEFFEAQGRLYAFKKRIKADGSPKPFDEETLATEVFHALTQWRDEQAGTVVAAPARDLLAVLPARASVKLRTQPHLLEDLVGFVKALDPVLQRPSEFLPFEGTAWDYFVERLLTADAMIADDGWEFISPSDIGCLASTLLLHAVVVGITPESFMQMIGEGVLSEDVWLGRWNSFQAEATRFDGRQLMKLFGSTDPVRSLPRTVEEFTDRDRKLIGRFVNRYFGELAGRFAELGEATEGDGRALRFDLPRISEAPEVTRGAIAMVASSLGKPIRQAFEHLPHPSHREWGSIRVPYLIGLLRVSSFLTVHSERAPRTAMPEAQLVTPISNTSLDRVQERSLITGVENDPEGLSIHVIPESVRSYLSIRATLDALQMSLDQSWAVIGEVYGRVEELRQIGFLVRRVRSNVDRPDELAQSVDYHPDRIAFDAAGVDLLKLLVRPLYGNNPSIGVRELLQNAVDAVRELQYLQLTAKDRLGEDPQGHAEDVLISLDQNPEGGWTLEVVDRGVGMTLDTVKNYLLRAGASFRRSDAWKEAFQTKEGGSAIARTGRFGIGILASFLLGDRIEVSTRHYSLPSGEGLVFSATVDDEFITVRKANLPVGTTIRVHLWGEETVRELSQPRYWDWYCLEKPKVRRMAEGQVLEQKREIPSVQTPEWFPLTVDGYEDVMWSHSFKKLICNGIEIGLPGRPKQRPYRGAFSRFMVSRHLSLISPGISLSDPDGRLPLNLERTELNETLPFERELHDSVTREFARSFEQRIPDEVDSWKGLAYSLGPSELRECAFGAVGKSQLMVALWFSTRGISFLDPWTLVESGVERMLLVLVHADAPPVHPSGFEAFLPVYVMGAELFGLIALAKAVIGNDSDLFGGVSLRGARILDSSSTHPHTSKEISQQLKKQPHQEEWQEGDWQCTAVKDCPESPLELREFAKRIEPEKPQIYIEVYLGKKDADATGLLQGAWKEAHGGAYAPLPRRLRGLST